jgi:hypothetical protein
MKNLIIEDFFVPITETEIEQFENNNNVIMPNYLKDFFLKYNGASVTEYMYFNEVNYVVNSFLPLLKSKITSVENFLTWIRDPEFCIGRNDLIPFATDPGNHPFLVSIGGDDEGVVYFSIVGFGEDNPLRKLADSFEEFINGLKSEEEI